ncbi:MAG: IS200/IS605 family transposase [Acidobacteria bacterium]|nr:MAG: IS200/IS605 family transposase [Acidobacteria bacterium 13_2_20CM_58_27]PYT85518.1 MAG: IS200/IS605 family transposase [Acidobacteriota bacterium]
MMLGYKSNKNVVYSSKYRVVWCPKYRRKVLAGGVEKRLLELIHEAAAKYRAGVIALEIRPDHVHLLVEVDPQFGLHRLVKYIKGVTSHELRKEFVSLRTRLPSIWTNSYFCSTVGGAPLEVIKQ